jgi:hypothetical protein
VEQERRAQAIAAAVSVCDGEEAWGVYDRASGAAGGGYVVSGKFNSQGALNTMWAKFIRTGEAGNAAAGGERGGDGNGSSSCRCDNGEAAGGGG